MHQIFETILFIIKQISPENNAILLIALSAFAIIGFSLYVLLSTVRLLSKEKNNNG